MEEEYILKYTGEETDALLKHTESLKDQTTAEDGETVQVYDESGIPHKIAKTELLNKAILATTSIQDISKFIAINEAGNAVGIMTLEQITEVFRKEFAKFPSSPETSAVVAVNKEGDALGLMSNEKLAQVVGGLQGISNKTLIIKDNIPDADEVYKYVSEGLTTIYVGNMANCPVLYGVLIHVQRAGKGDVTGSQIINQIIISNNKFYYRYGQGNDNSVQYESWI